MRARGLLIVTFMVSSQVLTGQANRQQYQPVDRPVALQEVYSHYFPKQHSKKIKGRFYENPYRNVIEHQFFINTDPQKAIVYMQGDTINHLYVLYDLYRDMLIAFSPDQGVFVELEKEFIQGFRLFREDGSIYEFVAVDGDNGFLQVLYPGTNLELYRKHVKKIYEVTRGDTYMIRFISKNRLILKKENEYRPVKTKKDLFRLYPGKDNPGKDRLKRYLRRSGFYLKKITDQQVIELGQFMDEPGDNSGVMEGGI